MIPLALGQRNTALALLCSRGERRGAGSRFVRRILRGELAEAAVDPVREIAHYWHSALAAHLSGYEMVDLASDRGDTPPQRAARCSSAALSDEGLSSLDGIFPRGETLPTGDLLCQLAELGT
jgi:hypothetical protein